MRVRFDPNQSSERATGAIVERIFIKEIAGGVRRDVVLQGARIKFLFVRCDWDREQIAASTFADKAAQTFKPRIPGTEVQIKTHRGGVVIDRGGVELQRIDLLS